MDNYSIEEEKSVNNFKHAFKIMRITILLLFFCILFSQAATGYSQGVELTLSLKSTSIKEVCEEIEKRSDFRFIFAGNAKTVINKRVDIAVHSRHIEEILDNILSGTELSYTILDNQVVVYRDEAKIIPGEIEEIVSELISQQQKRQVVGRIFDKNGEPIIGANIIERGTTNGTVTDIDGNFSLQVDENA
ncbi:MAG: carboxypeptidase-like regulatory domain-containing protein, partial [Proteiniphilum sp.]